MKKSFTPKEQKNIINYDGRVGEFVDKYELTNGNTVGIYHFEDVTLCMKYNSFSYIMKEITIAGEGSFIHEVRLKLEEIAQTELIEIED